MNTRMTARLLAAGLPLLALVALLASAGCETTFDPFEKDERYFSVYGYLDPDADTQFVRVVPVRDRILADDAPIDAAVTMTDATTGDEAAWRDSLFVFDPARGLTGHVFWSTQPVVPGHAYRLAVRRSDGAESRVELTAPLPPPEPGFSIPPRAGNRIRRLVRWPETFNVAELLLVYTVEDTLQPGQGPKAVAVDYSEAAAVVDGGVEIIFDHSADFSAIYNSFGFPAGTAPGRIALLGLEVRLAKADAAWTFVDDPLDLETLALPGRFTNVEQGFGFVGAVVRSTYPWTLPPEDVTFLGFTDPQE